MRAKTSKTFRRERKLAKEVQSSETAKLTGMRERVAAFFKFYDHASIFIWGAYGVPKSRVSDIFPRLPGKTEKSWEEGI
jgi:hypothetical protein